MMDRPSVSDGFFRLMALDELRIFLEAEIKQKEEEGFEVAHIREMLHQGCTRTQLTAIHAMLLEAQVGKEYPYLEPGSLTEIRAARPDGPRTTTLSLTLDELHNRVQGGWLGRVAGCVLGKPVEMNWSKSKLADYLKLADSYPLTDYIPRLSPLPTGYELNPGGSGSCLGEIHGAQADDDTDYTILGLLILEAHGQGFTTEDVAATWLERLAYHRTWTAERAVYRNLILGSSPAEAACVLNPSREFIGARIRVDAYGFALPGRPELAAELAYKDASLSHTKNGIYSAMFMAASIAWAFVTDDMEEIILVGLSEIPENCRLAEAIREVVDLRREADDWETIYNHLDSKFKRYHPVHAINNTIWMVLALLDGRGDLEKTICQAVMCGYDTDCNGANAGSVVGVLRGARSLPEKWTAPLQDTLYSSVVGFPENRISALAERTVRIVEQYLPIR